MEVLLDFGGFRVLGLCFSVLGAKGMVHRIFFSMGVVFELPPVVSAFFFGKSRIWVFSVQGTKQLSKVPFKCRSSTCGECVI